MLVDALSLSYIEALSHHSPTNTTDWRKELSHIVAEEDSKHSHGAVSARAILVSSQPFPIRVGDAR